MVPSDEFHTKMCDVVELFLTDTTQQNLHNTAISEMKLRFRSDLEKVENHPQAENSEFYNVLKIA